MFRSTPVQGYKAVVAIAFNNLTGMAKVTARSCVDGVLRTREMPMCYTDYHRWTSGEVIQRAMAHLPPTDREFLQTGMTDEQWTSTFVGMAGKGE